jgi:hypothetical protein
MRNAPRLAAVALLCTSMLATGQAMARDYYHGHRGHGHSYRGGGGNHGAVLAAGAIVGLALGAVALSAAAAPPPAPVVVAPPPVSYAPAPVTYAQPAIPPGYCYREYDRAYVPCQAAPNAYYPGPVSYGY